jgi:hypothetical protein
MFRLLILTFATLALATTDANAQSATGGAALEIQRSLSVATLSPMRFERDRDAAGLIADRQDAPDSPAVIRLSGDAGRAYRIRLPRLEGPALDGLMIWSANDGDISQTLSGRLDGDGRETLHVSGRLLIEPGRVATLPLSIDYD